jgi:hypothetical protein
VPVLSVSTLSWHFRDSICGQYSDSRPVDRIAASNSISRGETLQILELFKLRQCSHMVVIGLPGVASDAQDAQVLGPIVTTNSVLVVNVKKFS